MTLLQGLMLGALCLCAIGLYGMLIHRHLIRLLIAVQVLTKGVLLLFVAGGLANGNPASGASLAALVIAIDTVNLVVGLALAARLYRVIGTYDTRALPGGDI